ncbi:pyridoxamine kinase [uncultured Phocaeicola sp.]|uniref:pyridoxamine kinase n=1 Tax=uncultured Phocaeicola sp. TaxID=990718 RepID=UPI0025E65B5C|nr:pyridoxamine kinase [uncultured Phocaeicola sp.]
MADNYNERQDKQHPAQKPTEKQETSSSNFHQCRRSFLQNQVKKIVAVHDLSGVGHVSLMAVIPVLTSMGFQVCPLPTAVLSTHTQYPIYSFLDLTNEMEHIIENWEKLGIRFDTFYTGYLGSPQQAQIVEKFIREFRRENDMVVVDPVLGDNGHLYKGITEEMVTEMKKLIRLADIITPNLTELYYLLDMPFQERITDTELKKALKALSDQGPSIVIATSVPVSGDPRSTSVYAYNRFGNRYWKVTCPYLPAHYPGTGDTFTSVITGSLMQGDSLPIALDRATQFILQGIRATFGYEYNNLEGIMLEKVLHNLDMPIQVSSYELVE